MNKVKIEFDAIPQNEAFARMAISVIHGYDNKGGKIFLNAEIEEKKLHIEVVDRGSGIDNVEKARKPLYTTKPHEERSGLGFTVMEAFMDYLEVISEVGEGTTIIMEKQL